MHYRISFIFITFVCLCCFATTGIAQNANTDEDSKPVILYSGTPKKYEIADIKVEGVKNYEDYVLIGLSGLSVGQTITVPGDEITGAIKRYWRHGLFSNVQITQRAGRNRHESWRNRNGTHFNHRRRRYPCPGSEAQPYSGRI